MSSLNSLGFTPAPKAPTGKSASEKAGPRSAFGEVLGKADSSKASEKPSEKTSEKSESKNSDKPIEKYGDQKSEARDRRSEARDQKSDQRDSSGNSAHDKQPQAQLSDRAPQEPKTEISDKAENLKTPKQNLTGKLEAPIQNNQDEVTALDLDTQGLPLQPGGPALNGPVVDRVLNPAVNPAIGEPTLGVGSKIAGLVNQEDAVDSLTRRAVWNDFLRKMKDDLGVDAEDVLEAFASLTPEELAQPPQATVDKVVSALGLDPSQAQTAKNYFTDLVNKTHSKSLGDELKTSNKQINLTLMSQRDAQRKTLSTSLDQLNQNFFMQGKPPENKENLDPRFALATAQPQMEMVTVQAAPTSALAGLNSQAASIKAPTVAFDSVAPMSNEVTPKMANTKTTEKNTVDELLRQFMVPQAKGEAIKAGEASVSQAGELAKGSHAGEALGAGAVAGASAAGSLKGMLENLDSALDSEDDGDSEFTADASYLGATAGDAKMNHLNGANSQFQTELTKAGANQAPVGVADLVDKAQVMIHDGGGEMKVTMSPEGMGEVAMKVNVTDGKVSVQMITQSDEAKHMIERQLSELKSSLHSNHLDVGTIKIDSAQNLGKQMEQQYQDAQRQATQSAMEQFRQETGGWKRSFFEQPSAKLYRGQNEAPRDVQAPTASQRKTNASRRLDLVA